MFKANPILLAGAMVGLAASLAGQKVQAQQFQPPVNSLALDEEGTLEAIQGNLLKFRDSNQEVWVVKVDPRTTVSIEGVADLSYLKPGMTVELTGNVTADEAIAEPLAEIDVINSKARLPLGLFEVGETDGDAKPVRNPEPGEYRVRGRITKVNDKELSISAGRFKIAATAADDMKVVLAVDDPRLAQFGDQMKVKAWYYDIGKPNPTLNRPGQALAEEVNITLSNPPTGDKRGR